MYGSYKSMDSSDDEFYESQENRSPVYKRPEPLKNTEYFWQRFWRTTSPSNPLDEPVQQQEEASKHSRKSPKNLSWNVPDAFSSQETLYFDAEEESPPAKSQRIHSNRAPKTGYTANLPDVAPTINNRCFEDGYGSRNSPMLRPNCLLQRGSSMRVHNLNMGAQDDRRSSSFRKKSFERPKIFSEVDFEMILFIGLYCLDQKTNLGQHRSC